jgi:hypothetical protein
VKLILLESVLNSVRLTSRSACSIITPSLMMRTDFFLLLIIFLKNNFNLLWQFVYFLNTYVFINTLFTFCHCVTKKGSIFIFWFLDRECISKPIKCFCPKMAKGGVC